MSDTGSQQEEQARTNLGPGDRLQAQRIAMGLTLDELAKKMRLSEAILTNIEENDFSEISAPIFVKGYLRSYARIVNADENEIIAQYITDYTDEDPPISSTSNTAPEINADDARVKWVTYLIVFALIALLAVWWWNRYQQPPETLSLDTTVDDVSLPEGSSSPPVIEAETELTTSPQVTDPMLFPPATEAGGQATATDDVARPAAAVDMPPSAAPAPGETPEPLQSEAQIAPSIEPQAPIEASTEADLVIQLNADSWMDIKDGQGNQLVYDLIKSGTRLSLNGQPPFRVFAGNAYGVTITYRGEQVDLSDRIRADNTARLRIGQ